MTSRHFDTVAFDVREDTCMLFFAKTNASGDIEDYLLVMRAEGVGVDEAVYLEINEQQLAGHDLISEARLSGNILTLMLREPADALGGSDELTLTWDDTEENRAGIEYGSFRVLGELLAGGSA